MSGLDNLRVVALAAVVAQHGFSVFDRIEVIDSLPLNIGQVGVSLFLSISGYLAAVSEQPPLAWLVRRLSRIYPAYWLAMLICFGVTWVFGYKDFGVGQFVSQMIGTGLYTHPKNLVNVPTWFISLLLLCYLSVFVARLVRAQIAVCLAVTLAAVWQGSFEGVYTLVPAHVVAFTAAYLVGRSSHPVRLAWAAAGALGVAAVVNPFLAYPTLSLGLLGLAPWSHRTRTVALIVEYTYEFYLIHSIFFVGAGRFLRGWHPFLAICCAVVASFMAAIVLSLAVRAVNRGVAEIGVLVRAARTRRSELTAPSGLRQPNATPVP